LAVLHISLLGGFEARLGSGEALLLKGRKTQALVAYLALSPDHPRSREELVGLLWGDRGEQQARSSLRQSLSELRKALGDADNSLLLAGRDTLSLDAAAIDVDVTEFHRLIDDGTPTALEQAAELYRGDLLDGMGVHDLAFEDWLRDERQRLHELACEALSKLLDHQAAGDIERAIVTARRLLALDPLREGTHRALMRLYTDKGERTLALKQYKACRDILAAELGVSPELKTEQLTQEIRTGAAGMGEDVDYAPQPQAPAAEPLPLPNKPSIAVLPFDNLSGDAEQEYFADGITEDLITELTRFRSLFVIARSSSFHYKGQYPKVQDVGRELGIEYVVEGSVRKAGNRVRITAQLVEAATGNHIWAERWDRELEDIFAVQDDLVKTIVSTVGGRIDAVSKARAARMSDAHLGAYDYYLRAVAAEDENTKEGYQQARQYLERAIKLDPGLALAHHHLSLVNFFEWMAHWVDDRDRAFTDAMNAAQTAVALDDTDGRIHGQLGMLHLCRREFDEASQYFQQAIRLNPNDFQIIGLQGLYLTAIGDPNRAIERFDQAMRLNPMEPSWIRWLRGIACFTAERFEDAINDLRSIKRPINEVRGWLAASYALVGRIDEARAMIAEFLRVAEQEMAVFPGGELDAWQSYWHGTIAYKSEANFDRLFEGLRKAGME
jgi:TolB-like protein/Tfp pilus assembly protein PilF